MTIRVFMAGIFGRDEARAAVPRRDTNRAIADAACLLPRDGYEAS